MSVEYIIRGFDFASIRQQMQFGNHSHGFLAYPRQYLNTWLHVTNCYTFWKLQWGTEYRRRVAWVTLVCSAFTVRAATARKYDSAWSVRTLARFVQTYSLELRTKRTGLDCGIILKLIVKKTEILRWVESRKARLTRFSLRFEMLISLLEYDAVLGCSRRFERS